MEESLSTVEIMKSCETRSFNK